MTAYLLRNNANPNARDIMGKTPMHYACDQDYPPLAIVASLLGCNAGIAPVDDAGDTPLHLLFRRNAALALSSGESDSSGVLSAISETVDLILTTAAKKDGSFEVRKVLALKNKLGDAAFKDEDKELHFKLHRNELKEIMDLSRGNAASADNSLLEKVLTQQAVHQKWTLLCWKRKLKESLLFAFVLMLFTVVAVSRTGFGRERSDVNSGLKRAFKGTFGPGGRGAEDGALFDDVTTAPEALLFFEGVAREMGLSLGPHGGDNSFASPLSPRSAGEIVGNPVVKQWRVARPGTEDARNCQVSAKIRRASTCSSDFNVTQLSFSSRVGSMLDHFEPSIRAQAESQLKLAFEPRSSYYGHRVASRYPKESYMIELPLSCLGDNSTSPVCGAASDQSASLLRALRDGQWVDSSTIALSFEVHVCSI